jgi:hypothetical protein
MKLLLSVLLTLSTFSSFAHESHAGGEESPPLLFDTTRLSMQMLESKIPPFRNLWNEAVVIDKKFVVFKQEGLFVLDNTQYRDVSFNQLNIKMRGYSINDASTSLQSEGFLTNKIRLMAGMTPVSVDDNRPVMLCKLENHTADRYYEMSVSQYKTLRKAYPSNYDMSHLCLGEGLMSSYWKARLGDFYDEFGNRK